VLFAHKRNLKDDMSDLYTEQFFI